MKMFIFCQRSKVVDRAEISAICGLIMLSFWTEEPQKSIIFRVWGHHFCLGGAPTTSLKSATLWGSCCLKTSVVAFVAKNCWFYQKLKKNRYHKLKLISNTRGAEICYQFVATKTSHQYAINKCRSKVLMRFWFQFLINTQLTLTFFCDIFWYI